MKKTRPPSQQGAATLPSDYTFTAGDAGAHTFADGVTLTTAGLRSVDVTDGTHVGATNVTVHPAPPSQLVLETAAGPWWLCRRSAVSPTRFWWLRPRLALRAWSGR